MKFYLCIVISKSVMIWKLNVEFDFLSNDSELSFRLEVWNYE